MPIPERPLPADVLDALQRGSPLEAIKLLRESTGVGLKEAKDIIDGYRRGSSVAAPPIGSLPANVVEAMQRGNKIEGIKLLRDQTGLGLKEAKEAVEASEQALTGLPSRSPGEESRRGSLVRVVVLAAAALVAYYFLRRHG